MDKLLIELQFSVAKLQMAKNSVRKYGTEVDISAILSECRDFMQACLRKDDQRALLRDIFGSNDLTRTVKCRDFCEMCGELSFGEQRRQEVLNCCQFIEEVLDKLGLKEQLKEAQAGWEEEKVAD